MIVAHLKAFVARTIQLLPWGRDLYLTLWRSRLGIAYAGVFDSFEAAQAVVADRRCAYDIVNQDKSHDLARERKALDNWFPDTDYPLLFWLTRVLAQGHQVLELGGSVGHLFYAAQRLSGLPAQISWTIAELPEAVDLGRRLAAERDEQRLKFADSSDIETLPAADIFVTSGTLQYMQQSLPDILESLESRPRHVLLHNLPVLKDQALWTLQDLQLCQVPYAISSESSLLSRMSDLGYRVVARWVNPRSIDIPFHAQVKIEGYIGCYFVLD